MPIAPLRGIILRRVVGEGPQQNPVWELVVHFDEKPPNDKFAARGLNPVDLFKGALSYCEQELSRERQRLGLEPSQLEIGDD